jgi:hypothetical protein
MERMDLVKKLIATLIVAGFLIGVVGCGSTTTAPKPAPPPPAADKGKAP